MTKIEIYKKSVYGNINIYVADSETAQKFQAITGKKTLNEKDLKTFESLGFEFTEVIPQF